MWKDMIERKYGHPDTAHNPRHECPWCGWRAAYIGETVGDDGKAVLTFKCRRHGFYKTDGVRGRGWQVPPDDGAGREGPKPAEGGEQRPGASMPPITRPDW